MVTHSLDQALGYGDRLVMLAAGRIAGDWSAEARQGLNPERLRALYGSDRVGGLPLDAP